MNNLKKREYEATIAAHIVNIKPVPHPLYGWDKGIREIVQEKFIISDVIVVESVKLK